ncbi:MAG: Uma2 family endonuclease [Rhodocyclaceae bacterium]|nr:Uma2 family endonuclease [Rhodocyclaceae bacterium]
MSLPQAKPAFSIDDYMTWEAEQVERHEYLNGEVFAMTGARDAHNTIALNIASQLRGKLRGGPCRAFIADMKLRVDAADAVFYPDVLVICDARDKAPEADTVKRHPCLIVEVLSESTAAYDRGIKFEHYRGIDTLKEYLLVEQDRRHIDLFRRGEDGRWMLESFGPEGTVALESVGVALDTKTIYEDVPIPSGE